MKQTLTAILTREDGGFVALCPEVDVTSQGATVEEAKANLKEAVELFFECASDEEVRQRMASESFNPHFPALRSDPMAPSGASRRKQPPSS